MRGPWTHAPTIASSPTPSTHHLATAIKWRTDTTPLGTHNSPPHPIAMVSGSQFLRSCNLAPLVKTLKREAIAAYRIFQC